MSDTEIVYGGYTRAALQEAFDKVKNPKGWKERINITLHDQSENDIEAIEAAVAFFCGSPCDCIPQKKARSYKIKAPGYYVCIGA